MNKGPNMKETMRMMVIVMLFILMPALVAAEEDGEKCDPDLVHVKEFEIRMLKKEKEIMQENMDELSGRLETCSEDLTELQGEENMYTETVNRVGDELQSMILLVTKLSDDVRIRHERIHVLEKALILADAEIPEEKEKLKEFDGDGTDCCESKVKLTRQLLDIQVSCNDLKAAYDALKKDNSEEEPEVDASNSREDLIKQQDSTINELREEVESHKQSLEESSKCCEEAREEKESEAVEDKTEEEEEVWNDLEKCNTQLDACVRELKATQDLKNMQEQAITMIDNSHKTDKEKQDKQIKTLETKIEKLSTAELKYRRWFGLCFGTLSIVLTYIVTNYCIQKWSEYQERARKEKAQRKVDRKAEKRNERRMPKKTKTT